MGDYLMSLIKANDIQNASGGIPTVKSQQLIPTAWVNFNGTGTVAIRDSENVSSITDNSTGNYMVNFSTNLANSNYAITLGSMQGGAGRGIGIDTTTVPSVSRFRVFTTTSSAAVDSTYVMAIVMGGQ